MFVDTISTVLALLCTGAAGFFAYCAREDSDAADAAAEELRKQRREVLELHATVGSHTTTLRRMEGKISAMKATPRVYDYPVSSEQPGPELITDPELAAELALQNAPPVKPGMRQ